jgi:hypothetical protein
MLLGYDYFQGIPVPAYAPALPAWGNELFYPQIWFWLFLGLSVIVMVVSGIAFRTSLRADWFVLVFLLLSVPHLYLVWHGDALDVERHAVLANVQFHLGAWLLFVLLLDRFLVSVQRA